VQGFEIAGLYVLVAITVVVLRHRIPELMAAPLPLRLAVGAILVLLVLFPFLLRGVNLIPDRLEPVLGALVVAGLIGLIIWFRR
jgi:hypothetical protein